MQHEPIPTVPAELLERPLYRLGEGIGKVVYASDHWVVKRERKPHEIVALVAIWRFVRRFEHLLPGGAKLLSRPSRQLRALRVGVQAAMRVLPRGLWYVEHAREVCDTYLHRSSRGEALAREKLAGASLIPHTIAFPTTRVPVRGWPGWITVSEATERVESTLDQRIADLARAGRFEDLEKLLDSLLDLRAEGWSRGLFSLDAHLKNFGVIGDRVVLIDPGGLTDEWHEIDRRLCYEEVVTEPHIQLGLGAALAKRHDIADRFNARWKAMVNRDSVARLWCARAG
jgi:hypothetical protein